MRVRLAGLALLGACGPGRFDPPEVWGLEAAEDVDRSNRVVQVDLTAGAAEVHWIDGQTTTAWTYNGTVPGPLIQARVGDTLRVEFTNRLPQPTTIHWHGLRVPDAMDGVPAVQDPIHPGDSFTYEFELPDSGTFWYHPHVRSNVQLERGLHGMLVVHELDAPAYDQERAFVLDDVALSSDGDFTTFDLERAGMDGMHGRHGNILLANGSASLLEAEIERGTLERWRLVNTANARILWADVQGADWRVVAVDGTLLPEPIEGQDMVMLPVGRRFDLEVSPQGDAAVRLRVLQPNAEGTMDAFPMFEATPVGDGDQAPFLAWEAAPLPPFHEIEQQVEIELDADVSDGLAWTINGTTYVPGDAIPVVADTPTRVIVRELSGAPHPFHLHGQFFQMLRRDGPLAKVPGQLDTILVDGFEEMALYTEFSNPGRWMAHCHILEHAELGMMTEFDVQP